MQKQLILVLCLLLLSGCTSAEYKESMGKGEKALQESKFEEAVSAFKIASTEEPNDDKAKTKLEKAQKLWDAQELDEEKKNITKYLEEIRNPYLTLIELSGKWDQLRNQSANGQIDDYTFGMVVLQEIIPKNQEIADVLAHVIPPINDLSSVHEDLINAVEKQHQGFTEVVAAIDQGDYSKLTNANNLLAEARKSDREFATGIKPFIDKHKITFIE